MILIRQNNSAVVSAGLIDEIIGMLGIPEEFSELPAEKQEPIPSLEKSSGPGATPLPHRLYRNPEEAKLAGVCSGLAAYFNTDPALIRIIFLFPLMLQIFLGFFGGTGFTFR
ncbi:MAG: PspC domain-containing protein [Rikenellaceae bacterium]|nr:PspC domain-containing protein [Rikenellaceae bacterium]